MPDDFDLFPDRKNLDPFSFGKDEKGPFGEKPAPASEGAPAPGRAEGERPAGKSAEGSPSPAFPDTLPSPPGSLSPPAPRGKGKPLPGLFDQAGEGGEPGVLSGGGKDLQSTRKKGSQGPSRVVVFGGIVVLLLALAWAAQTFLFSSKPAPPSPVPPAAPSGAAVAKPPAPVAAVEPGKAVEPTKAPEPAKAAEPTKASEPAKAAETTKAAEPGKAAEPPKAPEPAKAGTPVKAPESAKPAASAKAARPAPVSPGKGGYLVQVGGAAVKENLDSMERKVREAGYEPILLPGVARKGAGPAGPVSVTVGPFATLGAAETAAGRLLERKIRAILRKGEKGSYTITAGTYPSPEAAKGEIDRIKGLGFPVQVSGGAGTSGVKLTLIRVGPFATEAEAAEARDRLAGRGFTPILVRP